MFREVTEDELKICPGNWKYGSFFTTILTECRLFLPWAMEKFRNNGGKIKEKEIYKLEELSDYEIIVNCSGLGAKKLCKDHKLVPIRGQVVKVPKILKLK